MTAISKETIEHSFRLNGVLIEAKASYGSRGVHRFRVMVGGGTKEQLFGEIICESEGDCGSYHDYASDELMEAAAKREIAAFIEFESDDENFGEGDRRIPETLALCRRALAS